MVLLVTLLIFHHDQAQHPLFPHISGKGL